MRVKLDNVVVLFLVILTGSLIKVLSGASKRLCDLEESD